MIPQRIGIARGGRLCRVTLNFSLLVSKSRQLSKYRQFTGVTKTLPQPGQEHVSCSFHFTRCTDWRVYPLRSGLPLYGIISVPKSLVATGSVIHGGAICCCGISCKPARASGPKLCIPKSLMGSATPLSSPGFHAPSCY